MELVQLWRETEEGAGLFQFDKTIVEAYVKMKFNNEMTLEHFIEYEYGSPHVYEIQGMIDFIKSNRYWKERDLEESK